MPTASSGSRTLVDTPTDPDFYRHIAQSFPDAWLEDPDLETEEARNALSAYQDRLLQLYEDRPDFVQPGFHANVAKSFIAGGLRD